MLSFKEYLLEQLYPTVRLPNGMLIRGRRGGYHPNVPGDDKRSWRGEYGFVAAPGGKKFMRRGEAAEYADKRNMTSIKDTDWLHSDNLKNFKHDQAVARADTGNDRYIPRNRKTKKTKRTLQQTLATLKQLADKHRQEER